MHRRGNHDDAIAIVATLMIFGSSAWTIGKGWGLLVLVAVIAAFHAYESWIVPLIRAASQRRLEAEPCQHGVRGASVNPSLCSTCAAERARVLTERRIAEQRANEEAERERRARYHAWLAQIRLPQYLRTMHPEAFEHLVLRLFRQIGYQVEGTPYKGDNGSDGFLMKDGARAVLQCKRVKGSVGEPVLRDLFGTMHATGCQAAVVVTTGTVSKPARAWAEGKPFCIVELPELEALLRQNFPESEVVPEDFTAAGWVRQCPKCGAPLRIVRGRFGPFIGCTGYPKCRFTTPGKVLA